MNIDRLRALLSDVEAGKVAPDEALERLKSLPFTDLKFAKVDHHRVLRNGYPEVIYGEGKTSEQILAIAKEILEGGGEMVLVTRVSLESARALEAFDPPPLNTIRSLAWPCSAGMCRHHRMRVSAVLRL